MPHHFWEFISLTIDKWGKLSPTNEIAKNKIKYLKKFKIYQLFDEIIWLNENDSKADYIINKNSIFIDDSFSQRLEVEDKLGIPTFEPNMIEVLLNEKTK